MDLTPPPLSAQERSLLHRLPAGGCVQRNKPLAFVFNGSPYLGLEGDTLASALQANGLNPVMRNWPWRQTLQDSGAVHNASNTLVEVCNNAKGGPVLRMGELALFDGLQARTMDAQPGAAPLVPQPMPSCDVLVVGSGLAGIRAALAAAEHGARVVCADQQSELGGWLLCSAETVEGMPAMRWLAQALERLRALHGVLLPCTRVTAGQAPGHWQLTQHYRKYGADARISLHAQRWDVQAAHVVLATGAHELPLPFADRQLSGVLGASEVSTSIRRFAVLPGKQAVVYTNQDCGYDAALSLQEAGARVTVVDSRWQTEGPLHARAQALGIAVLPGHAVVQTLGWHALRGVKLGRLGSNGAVQEVAGKLACDLLAVSGGLCPATQPMDAAHQPPPAMPAPAPRRAGACRASMDLQGCANDGQQAGVLAAMAARGQ